MWPTLAPEFIYEVLDQCRADCKILSVYKPSSFPWYLGHICRAWREVFISSPRFWNALDICIDFKKLGPHELRRFGMFKEVARIGIVRSKDCPISFRLFITGYSFPEDIALGRQIIKSLVENSARWCDAYIYVHASDMAIIYPAKNRMPLLRSLRLSLLSHAMINDHKILQASDAVKRYSDFLMCAPQLTRIRFEHNSQFWKINWSLITIIHFHVIPPPSQLLAYLSQMSCLVELVILDNFKGDELSNNGMAPVTIPHLKSLYSPAVLLPIVYTPVLQELHIRNDLFRIKNTSALKAIIFRYFQSFRCLSKLEITTYGWEDAALIIQHMPRVDHLILSSGSAAELVEILADYPQSGSLKTVTFILRTNQVEEVRLLETITSWKRKPGETRGIGPFHALTEMTFKLLSHYHQRFIDVLKLHLEAQEMHYTISDDPLPSFPQFDVL